MLNPYEFVRTIYLGDRACKSILIDGWNGLVKIHVDLISRIRGESWEFYGDEDITEGLIVISEVKSFQISPDGSIPNDNINFLKVEKSEEEGYFLFLFSAYSANSNCEYQEVVVSVLGRTIHLEDPLKPDVKIIA